MNGNSEKITRVLELLTEGLAPYVEGKLRAIYRENWQRAVQGSFRDDRTRAARKDIEWDAASLLTVMWDQWNSVFRHDLGHYERSLVSELREFRNRWAHQQSFDFDDTYRVTDSIRRLLQSVNAANLEAVRLEKSELLESHVAEAVNSQVQRTAYNRNKWWIIGIYAICCVLILGFLIANNENGPGNYFIMTTVLLAFVYMIYQQFKMEPPLLYGPRECHRCHRIVYRQSCPYCDGT
ncbi:MAG: Swt1 family HEPN domain-containing protein [Planctomycetaceae bacterium]